MYDPLNPRSILAWTEADLALLPQSEDQTHEFKSGVTKDGELAAKLSEAASGFWNAGGGLFVCGIDKTGRVDGGLAAQVGRQSRRDWVDQVLHRVAPQGPYEVRTIEPAATGSAITTGNCVLLVAFGESRHAPHMAPDNRYYIRAGAHTAPASHYLVEAIRARRQIEDPLLSVVVRPNPDVLRFGQILIVALTAAPAIDVVVRLAPPPPLLGRHQKTEVSLHRSAIDRNSPLAIDATFLGYKQPKAWMGAGTQYKVEVSYRSLTGAEFKLERTIDFEAELGPPPVDDSPIERISNALAEINIALQGIRSQGQTLRPPGPAR